MSRLLVPCAALLTAAVLLSAAAAAPAATPRPGTVAGSLGVAVPKGGHAFLRAANVATGEIAAARTVGRTGAYRLTLPPGVYLLTGSLLAKGGVGAPKTIVLPVSLKAGQQRKAVTLKAKKKARRKARARAAFVTEGGARTIGGVAVGIEAFTGGTGDIQGWNRGIPDMITTGVVSAERCDVRVVEVLRRADVEKEGTFRESGYVDVSQGSPQDLIVPDVRVRGTLTPTASGATYRVEVVDATTGAALGAPITGSMSESGLFRASDALADEVAARLCNVVDSYKVTLDIAGTGTFATHMATGRIAAEIIAKAPAPGGTSYSGAGTLTWLDLSFASHTGCTYGDAIAGSTPWSVTLTKDPDGNILDVIWGFSGGQTAMSTATVTCPGDPPAVIPGQPGPTLMDPIPNAFPIDARGESKDITADFTSGGDGWRNPGRLRIEPNGVVYVGP